MSLLWHNGAFKDDQPLFHFNDRIRLGDGVFDTMLAINGRTVSAELHFQRLIRNAAVLKIHISYAVDDLMEIAEELLHRNQAAGSSVINTLVTRGPAGRGLVIPQSANFQIAMKASPAPSGTQPVKAILGKTIRRNEGSPLSQVKSLNYGDQILALEEAHQTGGNEVILLNNKGHVACAATSNIFVLRDGELLTPPLQDGVIGGIVRHKLIEQYHAREKSFTAEELKNSEGAYLSNSVRGVIAVETLDGKKMREPFLKIDKNFHLSY